MSELYWIIYDDDVEALQEYFETGGTIEDDSVLYDCINENASECYPILMNHIKEIPDKVWIMLSIEWYFYDFIRRGYAIPYNKILLRTKIPYNKYCECLKKCNFQICIQDGIKNIAKAHREAITLLCIAKRMGQPMSNLLKMIAMDCVWALHDSATIYRCNKCGKEGF